MTFRENNSWIVANSVKEIWEKTVHFSDGKCELRKYNFDHNGLPIVIVTAVADSNWIPGESFTAEVEYQFTYVMDDLFLRRESSMRNVRGLMKRENIFSEVKYINYFNRTHYKNSEGLEMEFLLTPGGRPLEIRISRPDKTANLYNMSYQSSRLLTVEELFICKDGEKTEMRSATYEYDRHNRPKRILIENGESNLTIMEFSYDQRAFPEKKTVYEDGKLKKKVFYYYSFE